MARPITSRLNPAPVRRMMARPVGEVGALATLPVGILVAAGAAVVVLVIVLLATRSPVPGTATPTSGGVAGSTSNASARPGVLVPIRFGTAVDAASGEVTGEASVFTRGDVFAYSLRLPEPVGTDTVEVEVVHRAADGTQSVVQAPASQPVDPGLRVIAFQVTADALIDGFGTGDFQMRVYRDRSLIAQGHFTLTEG